MPRAFDLGFDVFQLEGEVWRDDSERDQEAAELEEENAKLKAMYAEMSLENRALKGLIEKKGW